MADKKREIGIVVDDGSRRVPIKNTQGEEIGVFYFRPTDVGIIERYNAMLDKWDDIVEPLRGVDISATGEADSDDPAQIAALKEAEKRLFEAVDYMFGGNMSEAFFGKMHPFSPVGGRFYAEHAIEAAGEYVNAQIDAEAAQMAKRVEKYTAEYEAK